MKSLINSRTVRKLLRLVFVLAIIENAWAGSYRHGTVVRMHMGDCIYSHRGFIANFGSQANQPINDICPEYTLVSDTVVYVIIGKSSSQMIPLADEVDFRLVNNELALRVDDAKHESKFAIKEMILRSEWDLVQKHITDQLTAASPSSAADANVALRNRN